jgi:hypothetical protein
MALDGSIKSRYSGEPCFRRLRPITLEYAEANLPRLIIKLKRRKLLIHASQSREHPRVFIIYDPKNINTDFWVLLEEDFEKTKEIAKNIIINQFPSENIREIEARIRAYVAVEFARRGVPT